MEKRLIMDVVALVVTFEITFEITLEVILYGDYTSVIKSKDHIVEQVM